MDKFNTQYATRKLREDKIEETSMTGAGEATLPRWTGPKKKSKKNEIIKKVGDKYAVYPEKGGKRLGTHDSKEKAKKQLAAIEISKAQKESKIPADWNDAPSIPNRPSKGGFQYKQLFENMTMSDVELDYPEFIPVIEKVADYLGIDIQEFQSAQYNVEDEYIEVFIPKSSKVIMIDVLPDGKLRVNTSSPVSSMQAVIEESYSRFKKETKTRTNEQQLHTAMRLAEKKIREANRILEYTSQLRGELNETRMNKNTQKLMERITRGIAEAYGKMKKLK